VDSGLRNLNPKIVRLMLTVNRGSDSDRGVINLSDYWGWKCFCITLALSAISCVETDSILLIWCDFRDTSNLKPTKKPSTSL